MTFGALVGLVGFVLFFAAVGYAVTAALAPRSMGPSLALAYPTGIATLGTVLTLEVIAGIPFSTVSVLLTAALLALGSAVTARARGRRLMPAKPAVPAIAVPAAVLVAAIVVILEAAFRAGRLQGLFGWDAGSFWVPKAKVLYLLGGLDEEHFTTLPGPTYPPLVTVLQATAFMVSRSTDAFALHLVYWSILGGFALGAAWLLARHVGPTLAAGTILLIVTAGEVRGNAMTPQGDFLMDVLFAFAALLTLLWIRERDPAFAAFALVFVASAALTKREALLIAACLGGAALVATARRRRSSWRWALSIPATAVVAWLPWSMWFASRDVGGNAPDAGPLDLFDYIDRVGPATRLVARTLVDSEHWSVLLVVVALCIAAGFAFGDREEPLFLASFVLFGAAGFVWIEWSVTDLPLTQTASLNPIVRTAGAALIPAACCAPLVAARAFERLRTWERMRATRAAFGVVAAAALIYPAAVLAIDGAPRFPTRAECADVLATPSEPFELVYTRKKSLSEAERVRSTLVASGFVHATVKADGCGRWKVVNPGVVSLDQVPGHIADARRVGYDPWLERA